MNLDKSIDRIVSKAKLLDFIQQLPEGLKGVVLIDRGETNDYYHVGDITVAESCFLTQCFQNFLTRVDEPEDDDD